MDERIMFFICLDDEIVLEVQCIVDCDVIEDSV